MSRAAGHSRGITLFVYGTLRRGGRAHGLLGPGRFLRDVRTRPEFELVDLGAYPALVREGRQAVRGELWEVPRERLEELDRYEGDEYDREVIELEDGSRAYAWVLRARYARGLPRVNGADWEKR